MEITDPVLAARALVTERHPRARAALLCGSVLTARRTAFSDLDVVVLLADGADPYRESMRFAGWPAEVFVHTRDSWEGFVEREILERRSPLLFMCAAGTLLVDRDGAGAGLQGYARRLVAAGPPRVTAAELDDRRYPLTDLLDDLAGCGDPGERLFIVTEVARRTAEFVLLAEGAWLGGGKWLSRRLAEVRPGLPERLAAAVGSALDGDTDALAALADEALAPAGGRLWAGYRRQGVARR
ncbi:nucleotidyltransferase domain-containing protein [Streptomyces scopuliridis]|uniref:Nucleotidyltransferase domain-containing protein n=1 Tax=Streptomyces scopuliridis TaxID=452529 RepID=A0ACD4ZFD1_9ACTN|nr:nucleotidyltransferase domain-containing protein [Streptomyces scopuliridis]WSB96708.1 nucleotidyltransferase domain-containing protein [Streptomyces scopuliridis]WSC09588.1 nucleotidyltransferase domain-containing protein [Streptomyces scopuliridis]